MAPRAMTLYAPLILGSASRIILVCCLQIASGEEGWRADGGVNSSWIEDGTKGDDFAGNVELFDFATIHLCKHPSSDAVCTSQFTSLSI